MSLGRGAHSWDVDRGRATPETVFLNRRRFIQASGASALGAIALLQVDPVAAVQPADQALRDTLKPPPGSAFRPCARNKKFTVDRPVTDELAAARFNNFYEFGLNKDRCWREAQKLTVRPWEIRIDGLVEKPVTIGVDELIRKMPCQERLYRFRCVERWAMVVPWSGFPMRRLLELVRPLSAAKFVRFVSFFRPTEAVEQHPGSSWKWPYYEGLTIEEAQNELCFVATGVYGHDLPKQHGAPLRMVVPWKYGYKGPKSVVHIELVHKRPPTFWNDYAAHEYGFYSNVNPNHPHPRWSQKKEYLIDTRATYDTKVYNGYGEYVAGMYSGDEH